jgi:anti-sigma regulatory factor (Ser/Thr protein kinase)
MGTLLGLPSTSITTRSASSASAGHLDMVFEVEAEHLASVRRIVREHCRLWRVDEGTTERLVTAVNELVTNVVVHTVPVEGGRRPIGLLLQQVAGGVSAVVSDHDRRLPNRGTPTSDDESGRGWPLVQALVDESCISPTEFGKDIWFFVATSEEVT